MKILTPKERQELKARAHHLNPVILLGKNGLTDAVVAETACALRAHELIKVRFIDDDRSLREQTARDLCAQLDATLVVMSGKLAIIYKEKPQEDA